jgi:glycosyltransferase involved in cell wall biosynthesis
VARIAVAIWRGVRQSGTEPRDRTGETGTRQHLFDEMFSAVYDESILDAAPGLRLVNRGLPPWVQLALEVHARRDEYDAIVTWGDRLTLALMAIQSLSRQGKPHIPLLYWLSKPNIRLPMRAFGKSLRAIVTWSSVQRRYAIDELGFTPERVHLVKHYVDQVFWRPRERPAEIVGSIGSEMRDYDTLIEALRGTSLRCHIATAHVRVNSGVLRHRQIDIQAFVAGAGPNVSVGAMTPLELRELYAKSRFVVVPLLPSDTDNGVTVILEAMAMGKTVICSRTEGQVDVIQDGVTGLYVRQGDPAALREAMVALWNDPERARAMGERARQYIEEHHTLEKFCRDVKAAVGASL